MLDSFAAQARLIGAAIMAASAVFATIIVQKVMECNGKIEVLLLVSFSSILLILLCFFGVGFILFILQGDE